MKGLIVHNCNGAASGESVSTSAQNLDQGNSQVFASSLFVHLDKEGKNIAKPKNSDDKIVIGYTGSGLPFKLVVDGFYGCDREVVFSFIEGNVIPLMDEYEKELTSHSSAQEVTTRLIKTIFQLNKTYGRGAEFTLSALLCYRKGDKLFCAGFGIGDTGLLIKRNDGQIDTLVPRTEVDGFKDAFDNYCHSMQDKVIKRNTLFNVEVKPGEEIVGYTYIPPQLEKLKQETHSTPPVKQYTVHFDSIDKKELLFKELRQQIFNKQAALFEEAMHSGCEQRFGDDFTMSYVVIPHIELSRQIRLTGLLQQINKTFDSLLQVPLPKKGLFSWLSSPAIPLATQINRIKAVLLSYQDSPLQLEILIVALFFNPALNKSDHLATALGYSTRQEAIQALITGIKAEWLEQTHAFGFDPLDAAKIAGPLLSGSPLEKVKASLNDLFAPSLVSTNAMTQAAKSL